MASLPMPSATFQGISPFHPPTTLFSFREQNSSQCFRHLPGNGHFSPLTNSERPDSMAVQRCKVWRALRKNYHCITRLEAFFPDQKDKCVLSPSPQDMCLLLTNSRLFRLDGAFAGSDWERYLLSVTCWFPQELPLRDSILIPPQDTITSDW